MVAPRLPLKFTPSFGPLPSYSSTPQEHLLESTSIGSVMSAFGEGAKEGWGEQELGLDEDSVQTLRDIGLFNSVDGANRSVLRAFNESFLRTAAYGADSFLRLFPAVTGGIGAAVGEVAGDSKSEKKKIGAELTEFLDVGSLPAMTYVPNAGGYVAAGEAAYRGTVLDTARINNAVDNLEAVMAPKVATADALAMPEAPNNLGDIGAKPELVLPTPIDQPVVKSSASETALKDMAIEKHKGRLMIPFEGILESMDGAIAATKKYPALQSRLQNVKNVLTAANDQSVDQLYKAFTAAEEAIYFAEQNNIKLSDDVYKLLDNMEEINSPIPDRIIESAIKNETRDYELELERLNNTDLHRIANILSSDRRARAGELPDDFAMNPHERLAMNDYLSAKNFNADELISKVDEYEINRLAWGEEYMRREMPDEMLDDVLKQSKGQAGDEIKLTISEEQRADLFDYGLDVSGDKISREAVNKLQAEKTRRAETPKQQKLAAPLPVTPRPIEPQYTGKAGNINLDKLNTSDDVKGAIVEAAQANDDFNMARRGVVTWADTEALAQAAGIDASVLLKRNIGDAWNAHQIEAARTLLIDSAKSVIEAKNKAKGGADADVLAFQEAFLRHSLIQEQVSGITAEAGRALNLLRKSAGDMDEATGLKGVLDKFGGKAKVEQLIDAMDALDDPTKVSRFINDMRKPGAVDYALEYLYNAMLSNPATHAANLTGNALAQFWRAAETGVAGAIGTTRELMGSRSALAGDRVYLGEEGARLWGMLQGAPEGLRAAWRAIKTETPGEGGQKLEIDRPKAIPDIPVPGTKLKVPFGKAIRLPGTALMASDEFFKAVGYRASINAQAYRKAAKAKLKGQEFTDEVSKLTQAPTKNMVKRASQEADYVTFTKELGKGGKAVQNLLAAHPILKFVVAPFFRTPVNLLKYAGERTPLSLASKEVREILMGKKGAAARDEQFAKILLGTAVMTATFMAADEGKLTGAGPSDPAERAMWLMSGKQPYSVKIGDTYYSYARLEPFATLMGIAADAAEISNKLNVDEAANIGTLLAYSAGQNVLNKTWTKGISDVVEVMQDPERYGPNFVRQLVGRVVPAGVNQITRMDDPYLRDARNILDGIRSKLPGLSDNIYPKRDIFGNAIKKDGAAGPDIISPVFKSYVNADPVVKELTSLGIFPSKLDRQIRTVELNEKQYDDYQRIAGRLMRFQLNNLISTPGWENIPTGLRQDVLTKAISASREKARTLMLMQYPEIYKKALETKAKHMTGGK